MPDKPSIVEWANKVIQTRTHTDMEVASKDLGSELERQVIQSLAGFQRGTIFPDDLDMFERCALAAAERFTRVHYGYSLRGWQCRAFLHRVRPPPTNFIARCNADNPADLGRSGLELEPGTVCIYFLDPHGIACHVRMLDLMASQHWNSGLGWGAL